MRILAAILALASLAVGQQRTFPALETNNVWKGSNHFSNINGTLFADRYDGADASVKINACIGAVIAAGGGTCDARGLTGLQTVSQQINVGNSSQVPVTLLLPVGRASQSNRWLVTIIDGTSCAIKQYGNSSIVGAGTVMGGLEVRAQASTNVDSLYCTEANPSGGGSYVRAEGFFLHNPLSGPGTMQRAALVAQSLYDGSYFGNINVSNADPNSEGIWVYGACCGVVFDHVTSNANGVGGTPVLIKTDATLWNHDVAFYSLSADHPKTGLPAVEVSNSGVTLPSDRVNRSIAFYGLFTEFNDGIANQTGLKIVDARNVNVYTYTAGDFNGAGAVGIDISETAANQVRAITIQGFNWEQAPSTGSVGIKNQITGKTYLSSTGYIPFYSYGGTTGSQVASAITLADNDFNVESATGGAVASISKGGLITASDFNLKDASVANRISRLYSADDGVGGTTFSVDPVVSGTTANSNVRLFRGVNTSGLRRLLIFKGDGTGTATAEVDASTGKATFNGGVKLGSMAAPTCDATTRGQFNYTAGGTGVKDSVQVCAKDVADSYAWRVVY
jgi:hypothetical protein